jgi:hypothetical protein
VQRRRERLEPRGKILVIEVPESRRERARGLLGRRTMRTGSAMLLERTRSVHTMGMRFPIAVAFLDAGYRVLEVRRLRPGRVSVPRRRARHVLECRADEDIRVGDRLLGYPRAGRPWEGGAA